MNDQAYNLRHDVMEKTDCTRTLSQAIQIDWRTYCNKF